MEKNKEVYGQADPPQYNLKNVRGFNITMICGIDDLLVAPDDYLWLNEELQENGNQVSFLEYELGH